MLHLAASAMRGAGDSDSSVEPVKLVVTTIGTFLTAYGIRGKQYSNAQTAFSSMQITKRIYESQNKHHRSIFLAAASLHHQNRLMTIAYYRKRSALDDKLIVDILDFCLSPFLRVRRSSQSTLETIARVYRGTWCLCFPTLFDALKAGTDPDRMKGALYVLRYNAVGLTRIARDWRGMVQLTECLLNAHHETKASVQALVSKATDELVTKIKEPVSFDLEVGLQAAYEAANAVSTVIKYQPQASVLASIREGLRRRSANQDEQWDIFVDKVSAIASNPQLNWRYILSASRFLLSVMRRDRPADVRLTRFFIDNVQNPHPRIRDYGLA